MQLTRDEWKRQVEIAAAHKHGENNAGWYVFRRYGAGPLGILVIVGMLGYGAYWVWHHLSLPATGDGPAGLPVLFWIALVALILGTAYAFRPTHRFRPMATTMIRAVVAGLLWLGFLTYAITVIL